MTDSAPFQFVDGISSSYEEWFERIAVELAHVRTIVEVGTFNGGGTKYLEKSFPKAIIYSFERPDHFEPELIDLPKIYKGFSKRVIPIPELSPPNNFEKQIDLCVFDIGHDKTNLSQNINFWIKHLSKQGFLIVLLPWSNQKKRDVREMFLKQFMDQNLEYETIVNWVIIRNK